MRELSLNVMDIAQNSISAGASLITIRVEEDRPADTLSISVEDNGKGMSPETVQKVIDPFYEPDVLMSRFVTPSRTPTAM